MMTASLILVGVGVIGVAVACIFNTLSIRNIRRDLWYDR